MDLIWGVTPTIDESGSKGGLVGGVFNVIEEVACMNGHEGGEIKGLLDPFGLLDREGELEL
jgi:hypothetical protein